MRVVTTEQMRALERSAAALGLTSSILMEKAGLAVAQAVDRALGRAAGHRILVLVGPGNNGGDGLVAARHLRGWGARVQAFLPAPRPQEDPNLLQAQESGVEIYPLAQGSPLGPLEEALARASLALDALLGTGQLRPIQGPMKEALARLRRAREARPSLILVALDLPSGLDADTGAMDPACPAADLTVTLGYPKLGLFLFPGAARAGRLEVADIGLPLHLAQDIPIHLITPQEVRALLPPRPKDAHKGTFGRVMVAAGSINYIGAAYLACSGAARVGAGLVTLATPSSLLPILAAKLTEATFLPLPEAEPGVAGAEAAAPLKERLPDYTALLLGPGLGQHPATVEFIAATLASLPPHLPLVLDADALNALARLPRWWEGLKAPAVLTPHPGEMARLMGSSTAHVQGDRLEVARRGAREWGQTVVLKGAYTVVATPGGEAWLNPFANPALASAGTGDVLSGAIAGLLAQGLRPEAAAICGAYLHGRAGEMAAGEVGDAGALASDLLPLLPRALREVKGTP